MKKIALSPIGMVVSKLNNPKDTAFVCEKGKKAKIISQIIISKQFVKGLKGLAKFSHIWVIYFLDKINTIELITHPGPPSIKNLPKVGVFASRSQYRPNPIALKLVKLIAINKNKLIVQGLDAINSSPVLDIKPYVPGFDKLEETKIGRWYNWLTL
jgi:tRNA-Thr(GGU) m(6)t(6)A37 methyltransferase TsaA